MAYPFLPVNPCCTDVVLNTPCGCNSVLSNGGCGQSPCETNVILSSNILYNGPVLDCIIAEPCDTLNVILQKIDEIICNLLTQINLLNIQVHNITEQIINIEGDIIDINNTLDVCCNATTTTTTTGVPCDCSVYRVVGPRLNPGTFNYVPCGESQVETVTATDTIRNICVDKAYPVISIGRLSSVDTGECCIPTTTTTTTICSNPNVLVNGTFTSNLNGWTDSIPPDWTWSLTNGGSAHYTGRDENAILSQNALTPGVTYDITFNLWCANPTNIVKVLAGTTEHSVTGVSGYAQVNLILPCVGTSLFGFQGYDELGPPFDTIYINNIVVSEHCPQFTTTTTTTLI